MEQLLAVFEEIKNGKPNTDFTDVKVYEKSFTEHDGVRLIIVKDADGKKLLATGSGSLFDELAGEMMEGKGKVCPLSHENRLVLNRYFDYTVPQAFGKEIATMGLGDRLGLASPGHIETIRNRNIKPILAQQSIRELNLTDRSMTDIVDAASFAVFQEGYKGGFGADGDHLKEEEDIQHALAIGMSMLTLDCSDYIVNGISNLTVDEIREKYQALPEETRQHFENNYLDKTFDANGVAISFDEEELMKNVLVYEKAIDYMVHVYNSYIRKETRAIDFEVSIDETETITSPAEHFFVAKELLDHQVDVTSLAPRFCGEFQKGIDYIGDVKQFEIELSEHAKIADYFGYKLSIHSGSDKFTVFPIIAKHTGDVLHVKTAGTNWLEAIRVIAKTNPELYRDMHVFALENFNEALKYYHVTPDLDSIKPLDAVLDEALSDYMNDDAARQVFHVTYGLILTAKDEKGSYLFKDKFFAELDKHEEAYRTGLEKHIGKHLELLGF
ncbi:tagaturonate epimerase family protein [Oceanobacillus sp. FSL H7-0719]|uniref:tagaturonate epimerase family protein n=1 Tax=Oceanobacillus sp. FSL H7-0719 TaxID=2954507 RepID=UPI00324DA087